jgi:hypothetical protein
VLVAVSPNGNATGVSDIVLDALARAMQLDEAERAHLFDLAHNGNTPTATMARRRPARQQTVRPGMQGLLDEMTMTPAYVRDGRLDILATNRLGYAVFARSSPCRRGRRTSPGRGLSGPSWTRELVAMD